MRDDKNNLKVYHLQVITNPKSFDNLSAEFNFYSINASFDGLVTLTDSNKHTVDYLRFEDAEKIKPSKSAKEAAVTCLYFGWWYDDGSFRPISLISCSTGGGDTQTGYGYQGGGRGGSTTSNAQSIEDKIDDSKLDLCTQAILSKLKNATNADIKSIIDKLGGKSETYILTFKIADNNGNPGSTTQTSYNCYQTVIDNDFLYGIDGTGINKPPTDLAIAAVMIHEIVHAYFFSLYDDKVNSGVTNSFDNFDLLYKNYVTKTYVGADDAQHAQIWKSFIGSMASALQEYQTGSGANPSQFYQDIILGTLMGTQTFKDKYPQNSPEFKRILNNWLTEKNNQSNDPNYKPKGKPCQ